MLDTKCSTHANIYCYQYDTGGTTESRCVHKFSFRQYISFNVTSTRLLEIIELNMVVSSNRVLKIYYRARRKKKTLHLWKLNTKQASNKWFYYYYYIAVLILVVLWCWNINANLGPQTSFQSTTTPKGLYSTQSSTTFYLYTGLRFLNYPLL